MKKIFIILCVTILGYILISNSNWYRNIEAKRNIEANLILRKELIERVANNEIAVNENGKAELTERYNKIATNAYVKVFVCNSEEKVVAFLHKSGLPDNETYIFYSSTDDELIKKYVKDNNYAYIEEIIGHWFLVVYN